MEGIEYGIDPLSTDELFLIRQSYRVDAATLQLLAMYYVIGVETNPEDPLMPAKGTVFPLPDLHSVMQTNLVRAHAPLARASEAPPAVHQLTDINSAFQRSARRSFHLLSLYRVHWCMSPRARQSTAMHYLQSAFDELRGHVAFHPGVHGYQWEFPEKKDGQEGQSLVLSFALRSMLLV
jgi:hypothetical protein